MSNGLFQLTALGAEARPVAGVIAAALAAMLGGHAGWFLTDRFMAWRKSVRRDES